MFAELRGVILIWCFINVCAELCFWRKNSSLLNFNLSTTPHNSAIDFHYEIQSKVRGVVADNFQQIITDSERNSAPAFHWLIL